MIAKVPQLVATFTSQEALASRRFVGAGSFSAVRGRGAGTRLQLTCRGRGAGGGVEAVVAWLAVARLDVAWPEPDAVVFE